MAEIAVTMCIVVLKKTSTIIADLIVKEGSRFSRLQEEISWVEREMRHIQCYLKDVERRQGEIEGVANLIRDIRDLAYDVEDTMEKYFSPSPKFKGLKGFFKRIPHIVSNYYGAHNFLLEIEAIKRRVVDLNRVRQSYGINEQHSDQAIGMEGEDWNERRSFPHIEEPNITGFDDHSSNLVEKLNDGDSGLRVISITGMPGLGKTTLAKKVYNSVKGSFTLAAWVYVSEQPIIKKLWQDIAKQVGLKTENWEDGAEVILYEHLRLYSYILVIDDIWHTRTWDAMKNAIPTNSQNRSRIILTSRHRDVGVHVGSWSSLYELEPLGENYSKQIFQSYLGIVKNEFDPPGLEEIGDQILLRCGGIPLAIVVVTGLLKLRVRSVTAWKGVLEEIDKGPDELSKTFTLSYIDLPIDLKPCFLYFGIFPEDEEIDTFDLIYLWAAEGFIKATDFREVEEVGDDYLNHLIARNLIQIVEKDADGKVKSCRIHDILHSLCIKLAKDINFFTTSTDLTRSSCEIVRRVTFHGMSLNDHICSSYRTSKLRSLFTFKNDESWNMQNVKSLYNFQKYLHLARVLRFEGLILPRYIKEFWTLKNLTYLKLQIENDVPESIIALESLVTLYLRSERRERLVFPMVIWNMKRLRHLLLSEYKDVKPTHTGFDPNAIKFQNFKTLEVPPEIFCADWLYKFCEVRELTFRCASREGRDLYQPIVKELLCSTLKLNKLETLAFVMCHVHLPVIMLEMGAYRNLSNICLWNVKMEKWPQPAELPPNLSTIALVYCTLKEDPLQVMKNIPKLRILKLFFGSYTARKLVCTGESGNFPQLEQLLISTMTISEITIEDGGMPRLKELITVDYEISLDLPPRIERIWQHKNLMKGQ